MRTNTQRNNSQPKPMPPFSVDVPPWPEFHLKKELAHLTEENARLAEKNAELAKMNAKLTAQNAALATRVQQLEQTERNASAQQSHANAQLSEMVAQLHITLTELFATQGENSRLHAVIAGLNTRLAVSETNNQGLLNECSRLTNKHLMLLIEYRLLQMNGRELDQVAPAPATQRGETPNVQPVGREQSSGLANAALTLFAFRAAPEPSALPEAEGSSLALQ